MFSLPLCQSDIDESGKLHQIIWFIYMGTHKFVFSKA